MGGVTLCTKSWATTLYSKNGANNGWNYLLTQDYDEELDKVGYSGLTNRACRDALIKFLESNSLRFYKTEAGLGDEVCDAYIMNELETLFRLDMADAQAPWYEFVRDRFTRWLVSSLPGDKATIGRYLLTEPKFEQRFNEIHARYEAPAKATQTASTVNQATSKSGANKISQQQMYAMMMAPNGRCPKCNCPLKTRKSGLSTGKAAAGGILAGPIGAIVGASMGKTEYYCPACGYVR